MPRSDDGVQWTHVLDEYLIKMKIIITCYLSTTLIILQTGASICFQHWADFFLYWIEKI